VINVLGQSNIGNKYGLIVVNDVKLLQREIDIDSNKKMIDIKKAIPSLVLDLRYSTTNNFMNRRLYPFLQTTYLRLAAVNALKKVVIALNNKNITLKIFDAYRPYAVTEKIWEAVKDSRYAADPSKGSGHNRGIAVDLTIVNLRTKKELNMGTDFDNFTDTAQQDFTGLSSTILQNRILLKTIMEKYGFVSLDTEWWHFSLSGADNYELLNIPFDILKKINHKQKY
ncbi:MAG TPA: M15 family metallopeptidase, partial [Ginsengibacter sp.]